MISRLVVENFKCLNHVEINFAPITLIYGQNGTGKSSILQSLQLLKQSIGGGINYQGPMNFRNFLDVVSMHNEEPQIGIRFDTEIDQEMSKGIGKALRKKDISPYERQRILKEKSCGYETKFNAEIFSQAVSFGKRTLVKVERSKKGNKLLCPQFELTPAAPDAVLVNESFTNMMRSEGTGDVEYQKFQDNFALIHDVVRPLIEGLKSSLTRTFLITVERGVVPWSAIAGGTPKDVGIHGERLVLLLALIFGRPEYAEVKQKIIEWAERFGMPDLYAGWVGGNQLEASFRDPQLGTPLNLSVAGHGSKQILAVITQVFFSPEGSVISIEEPETSLHMSLLPELFRLFAEATEIGKQIVITTHSSILPSILKRCVPEMISHQNIKVYHLEKQKNGSIAAPLNVNEQGVIEGFIPSIREAEKKIMDM